MAPINKPANYESTVRNYFDNDSAQYESMRYTEEYKDCHQFSYHARRKKVLELLPSNVNSVLDIGCGPGVYTQDLLDRGSNITACDISPKMIEAAKAKFEKEVASGRAQFHVGDINNLQAKPESFDSAICIGVISYIPDVHGFLSRLASLLKPNGHAIIQISKKYSPKSAEETIVYPFLHNLKKHVLRRGQSRGFDFSLHRHQVRQFNRSCAQCDLNLEDELHFDYTLPLLSTFSKTLNLRFARSMEAKRSGVLQQILAGDYVARYRKVLKS